MLNSYQEKVVSATIKHEQENVANFYYVIWEVLYEYLVLLPKKNVEGEIINLGHIVVKDEKIWGNNKILISELEKRLNI